MKSYAWILYCMAMVMVPRCSPERLLSHYGKKSSSSCADNATRIVRAVNEFGFALSKEIDEFENMALTQLHTFIGLSHYYCGSKGETAQELEEVLGFKAVNMKRREALESFRQLTINLTERSDSKHTLRVSSALFLHFGLNVEQSYIDDIQTYFRTNVKYLDFVSKPSEVVTTINFWAGETIKNENVNLLVRNIPPDTFMFTSQIGYFNGTWKFPFEIRHTRNEFFNVGGGKYKIVSMMYLFSGRLRYFQDNKSGYEYLEIPYEGDEMSMILALPPVDEPPDLLMTTDFLCKIRSSLVYTEMERVTIPKLYFVYKKLLQEALLGMGLVRSFEPYVADFTGIRPEGVYLEGFPTVGIVSVHESGMDVLCLPDYSNPTDQVFVVGTALNETDGTERNEFVANRPFLFYVLHNKMGLVLYSGKVVNP